MKLKRFMSAALAVVLAVGCASSLAGCKKTRVIEKRIVENAYRVTTLEKPEKMQYTNNFFRDGDRIVMSFNYYDSAAGKSELHTYSMALDGTDLQKIEIPALQPKQSEEENVYFYIQEFRPVGDGTFWKSMYWSKYDPLTYESEDEMYLYHVDSEDNELFSISGTEIWGASDPEQSVWHNINYLTVVEDGVIFVDNEVLYYLSEEGSLRGKISLEEIAGDAGYIQQILCSDGVPYVMYCDYSGSIQQFTLYPLQLDSLTIGQPYELDSAEFRNVWNFIPGEGYTFYYNDEEAIYGYDLESGTSVILMNFLNSDVTSNTVSSLVVVSPDLFITNGYDEASNGYQLMKMERIPEDQQIPKYILTVATMDAYSVQKNLIRFNRQSDEYRFVMKTYSIEDFYTDNTEEYNYEKLREKALNALNNDIISGQIPDVLVVDASMQMDSYIAKGLFADLYEWIDKDERFVREDFLTNVLDAYSVNGKLYELAPAFNVRTLLGKKSMVGDRTGWTMREFVEWAKTIPEGSRVFYELTRDELLDMFCTYAYEEFVDPDTGKCSFDSEDFKLILEYVNSLTTTSIWETMNDSAYDQEFWEQYENRFRDDLAMLEQLYISQFNVIPNYMNHTFYTNEELVLVGLPSVDRNGSVIYASPTYAVSAQSPMIEGAWEFVSYFLTAEYQESLDYQFPIRLSALEKMADKAVAQAEEERKQYEGNQNGGDYIIDDGFVVMPAAETVAVSTAETETPEEETVDEDGDGVPDGEDKETPVEPYPADRFVRQFLTREQADEMIAFLKSLNHVYRVNPKVNNIIKEEAAAYFAGDKSLEETANLIQSRVSILVAEGR